MSRSCRTWMRACSSRCARCRGSSSARSSDDRVARFFPLIRIQIW
jgi:hypothetical protein